MKRPLTLLFLALLTHCNCGGTATIGGSGGGAASGGGAQTGGGTGSALGGGGAAGGGSDDDGGSCPAGSLFSWDAGACVPGGSCGSTHVDSARVEPNLIIALDRSCSMRSVINGKSKWQSAVEAITGLAGGYQGQIRFGLTLFPDTDTDTCGQGAIAVPIGDLNEDRIASMLDASLDAGDPLYPDGPCVTPIDTGVEQAAGDPGLHDPSHPGFLVLITDGAQAGCNKDAGTSDTLAAIEGLRDAGVDTFVIGFNASHGGIDIPALTAFAEAGGEIAPTAADGGYKFFDAQDQASLEAALAVVGGRSMSCNYDLLEAPPDPSKLYVFFDGALESGWSYDGADNRVVFTGAACEALKSGAVMKLDIVYGCPGIN